MRFIPCRVLPCLLAVQALAQAPLTFTDIQTKARVAPEQWRAESLLAERRLQVQEGTGFLREGPGVAFQAGPRRSSIGPNSTDKSVELDLPLFLSHKTRSDLERSLGKAHPLLMEAAHREAALRLRTGYLDAWLASRLLALREADLATVEHWLQAARTRFDSGADPAFQVALVEGEHLKVHQDIDEAQRQLSQTWAALVALAELPSAPIPLANPEPIPSVSREGLPERMQESPLRKALLAQNELEERSLRMKTALSLSRWSLRSSYAQEGDERITRVGIAVRLPRPGEGAAIRQSTETQSRALQGETRQALADLDARMQGVLSRLQNLASDETIPDFSKAVEAVGLRLQEGRERPSEALPIRRQLLEAQMASLRRIYTQHLLLAELKALLPEVNP